jgi:hypothetical protein
MVIMKIGIGNVGIGDVMEKGEGEEKCPPCVLA